MMLNYQGRFSQVAMEVQVTELSSAWVRNIIKICQLLLKLSVGYLLKVKMALQASAEFGLYFSLYSHHSTSICCPRRLFWCEVMVKEMFHLLLCLHLSEIMCSIKSLWFITKRHKILILTQGQVTLLSMRRSNSPTRQNTDWFRKWMKKESPGSYWQGLENFLLPCDHLQNHCKIQCHY